MAETIVDANTLSSSHEINLWGVLRNSGLKEQPRPASLNPTP